MFDARNSFLFICILSFKFHLLTWSQLGNRVLCWDGLCQNVEKTSVHSECFLIWELLAWMAWFLTIYL